MKNNVLLINRKTYVTDIKKNQSCTFSSGMLQPVAMQMTSMMIQAAECSYYWVKVTVTTSSFYFFPVVLSLVADLAAYLFETHHTSFSFDLCGPCFDKLLPAECPPQKYLSIVSSTHLSNDLILLAHSFDHFSIPPHIHLYPLF